ncbi:MAG: aminodeoxychorismate/anthranilate synthase component II [Planctomycetes bacterium]|nr:aminodeoxychorismate/anthranilate synthase component II [Planctomycetota bacterium]
MLVVDNYDSFTHNLVQPLRAWGHEVRVERNDAISVTDALGWAPERVLLSPGPKRPQDAGLCLELVAACADARLPLLGVCLGHQVLAEAFGGVVSEAERPLHGRATPIRHLGCGVLSGLPTPFPAARYHSLTVREPLPECLEATAWSSEGELMGLRHRTLPLEGVQFHPESYLTPHGDRILANFAGSSAGTSRG